MHARLAPLVVLIALAGAVRGQGDVPTFRRIERGLPHNTVTALLQDRRGFLWIGTADGLARYDGRQIRVFRRRPGRPDGLPSSTVQALAEAGDGTLWVGTPAGVCRLADEARGRFECPAPRPGGMHVFVADQAVWAADVDGVWRLDGKRFHRVEPRTPPSEARASAYGVHDGHLWVREAEVGSGVIQVHRADPAAGRLVPAGEVRVPTGRVPVPTPGGDFAMMPWAAFGLRAGRRGGWYTLGRTHTAQAPGGRLWVGVEAGLFLWDGEAVTPVPLSDASPLSNAVLALTVDRSGAVWVGTRSGLFVHDPDRTRFEHLDPAALGAVAPVMAVTTDATGTRWVGTLGGGLVRQRPGAAPEAVGGPLADALVWALAPAPDGGLWVGTDRGLCRRQSDGEVACLGPELARSDGLAFVYTLEDDGHAGLWAGGSSLVYVDAQTGRIERRIDLSPTAFGTLTALHLDVRGRLWVGAEKRGLWRLDTPDGALRQVSVPALDAASVWHVHEADDGALWLGTSDGLFRFDPATRRADPYALGLDGSTVYGVVPDGDRLWLATGQGLAWYRPADGTLRRFGVDEGVENVEFNRRAAHRAPDGRIAFGGMRGLTVFDPADIAASGPPPAAVVTRVRVEGTDGEAVYGAAVLRLGPQTRALTFDVAAPLPSGGAALRYAYRLDPLDDDWAEVEGEPVVRLAGLPPGRYTFRARASRGDGMWGAPAVVAVTLAPPWYRTWWARVLAVAALAGVVVVVFRARVRAVRREERMRWRIASDLHDDIGSRLASVALLTEHVRDQARLAEPEAHQLTTVAHAARGMVESLREIVWFVDPAHERPGAFAARVREAAASLVGPRATVDVPDPSRLDAAPLAVRRDVFLVLKEALHNAARHAPDAAVTVRLDESARALVLTVRDDGPGFDARRQRDGTGLRSLRRRAEALGGTLDVASAPGVGTTVTLRAPLP